MRLLGELAAAYGDGTVRVTVGSEPGVPLGAAAATSQPLYRSLHAAGLSRGGRRHARRRDQLPRRRVVQARRHAVARPRPAARRSACTSGPDLVAAVPGLDIKISGCPNGCGQHHIAGLGFQGSLRKVGGRPAPHYFVMVGGGVADGIDDVRPARRDDPGAPLRRGAGAADRALSATEGRTGESAADVLPPRRPRGGQGARSPGSTRSIRPPPTADDFIDLAEDHAFRPDVQEGECSA